MKHNYLKYYFTLIFIIFAIFPIHSQEKLEDFLRRREKEFQQFVDKKDKEFAEFLKKSWVEKELLPGFVKDKTPKPVNVPIFELPEIPEEEKIKEEIIPPPLPPVIPEKDIKEEEPDKEMGILTYFFGVPLRLKYNNSQKVTLGNQIDNEMISHFWEKMCLTDYEEILKQSNSIKDQMKLNDWGYYLLLKNIVDKIYIGSQNEKILVLWFLLTKGGYNAKVGYLEDEIYLLLPFVNPVFGIRFIEINKNIFYNVSLLGSSKKAKYLHTYKEDYPNSTKYIDLGIYEIPHFGEKTAKKDLSFFYDNEKHLFSVNVNNNLVNFYSSYPSTDVPLYFSAAVSTESANSLNHGLKPLIAGKSEKEAVNILLRFVQTSFDYKIDQEQFGKEKTLFIEETLFYPYSDCEDRAVLFAHLVRNILGLDIVGLRYDGHIASAVKFNEEVTGDVIFYSGEKYIICDPTYMYADAGNCMQEYKGKNPQIITIE